jgi:hypothetical protein
MEKTEQSAKGFASHKTLARGHAANKKTGGPTTGVRRAAGRKEEKESSLVGEFSLAAWGRGRSRV